MPTLVQQTLQTPKFVNPSERKACDRTHPSQKSDTWSIDSEARETLEASPPLSGYCRSIASKVIGKRIELTGELPSFYMKQVAQESLRPFTNTHGLTIRNFIVVMDKEETTLASN